MTKIYYLTRSYLLMRSGGVLGRVRQVELLCKEGFDITVITPNYKKKGIEIKDNVVYLPLVYNIKLALILERLGFYEDYLDKWVKIAFEYLKDKVKKDDILFATSGGELGNIKLASILKERIGCKYVANFRDPINYSLVNGLKIDNKFHISREKQEAKYLRNADLIITCFQAHQTSLQNKYPDLKEKIVNHYFGYGKKVELKAKKPSKKLRIAYGGVFSRRQSPEILAKIAKDVQGIEIYFIGDYKKYKPVKPFLNDFHFIPFLPHNKFLDFAIKNIDVGFVSLTSDCFGTCFPSKAYEYINLGLPIFGALPDVNHIVNQKGYGIICRYNDFSCLKGAIEALKDKTKFEKFKKNILRDRDYWAMENRIKELVLWLKSL